MSNVQINEVSSDISEDIERILGILDRNCISQRQLISLSCRLADGRYVSPTYDKEKLPADFHASILRAYETVYSSLNIFAVSYPANISEQALDRLPVINCKEIAVMTDECIRECFKSASEFLIRECRDKAISKERAESYCAIITNPDIVTVVSGSSHGLIDNVFHTEEYFRILERTAAAADDIIASAGEKLDIILAKHRAYEHGASVYYSKKTKE